MGREIRMVPPNWDHPKVDRHGRLDYQPMYDRTFAQAATEWKAGFAAWERGERSPYMSAEYRDNEFWEYEGGPPEDRAFYRIWKDEDATWFQLWETVSEGTPVSPPFATKQELADYLAENGDFWDQKRGAGGWGKKSASAFVEAGSAPSMMMVGGQVIESNDIPAFDAG